MTTTLIIIALTAWPPTALILGLALGRAIHLRDQYG